MKNLYFQMKSFEETHEDLIKKAEAILKISAAIVAVVMMATNPGGCSGYPVY